MSDAWGKHVATIFQSFIIVFPVHELNIIDKVFLFQMPKTLNQNFQ